MVQITRFQEKTADVILRWRNREDFIGIPAKSRISYRIQLTQKFGEHYPRDPDQQQLIHTRNYNYQSKETKHFEKNVEMGNPIEFKRDVFIPQEFVTPHIRGVQPEGHPAELPPHTIPQSPNIRAQEFQSQPSIQRFQNQNILLQISNVILMEEI